MKVPGKQVNPRKRPPIYAQAVLIDSGKELRAWHADYSTRTLDQAQIYIRFKLWSSNVYVTAPADKIFFELEGEEDLNAEKDEIFKERKDKIYEENRG